MITALNNDNFEQEIQKPGFAVVKVFSQTCVPCKNLAPHYEELASNPEYQYARFYEADAHGDCFELARKYRVMSVPTILIFHFGELVDRMVGGEANMTSLINALEANKPDFERVDANDFAEVSL